MSKTLDAITLHQRCVQAALVMMERKGYHVLDTTSTVEDSYIDIVANEDGVLLFAKVLEGQDAMPSENLDSHARQQFEECAAAYFAKSDEVDVRIRFDIISYQVVDSDRAFVRYHRNALAE